MFQRRARSRTAAGVVLAGFVTALVLAPPIRARQAAGTAPTPAASAAGAPAPARGGRGQQPPDPIDFADTAGWTSMFDGKTLNGWDGNPAVWRVEDGAITAESTTDRLVGETYVIWKGGEPADFEFKMEVKIVGAMLHSGFGYRSWIDPTMSRGRGPGTVGAPAPGGAAGPGARPGGAPGAGGNGSGRAQAVPAIPSDPRWNLAGIGMDYDYDTRFNGNVEERYTGRGELAWRGLVVQTESGKRQRAVGSLGDPDVLAKAIKPDDWNEIHIIARGHVMTNIINGQTMAVLIDDDPMYFKAKGLIGLQISGTGKISFRNLWIKMY